MQWLIDSSKAQNLNQNVGGAMPTRRHGKENNMSGIREEEYDINKTDPTQQTVDLREEKERKKMADTMTEVGLPINVDSDALLGAMTSVMAIGRRPIEDEHDNEIYNKYLKIRAFRKFRIRIMQ